MNGEPVTRAELGAHLERIDSQLASLHAKVDELVESVRAPSRWLSTRATVLLDRSLIVVATAVIAYIATHS